MTQRNVVVVFGSPRKQGNSTLLAQRVIAGAEAVGAHVTAFYLHGMDIQPCAACDACRGTSDAPCTVQDDMQQIYPALVVADALVIASPVYWFTMSAQTKLFLDRCYALGGPQGHRLRGKEIGILMTYGDADPFESGAVNALRAFQDSFNYLRAPIVGMVYGSAGDPGDICENEVLLTRAYHLGERLGKGA